MPLHTALLHAPCLLVVNHWLPCYVPHNTQGLSRAACLARAPASEQAISPVCRCAQQGAAAGSAPVSPRLSSGAAVQLRRAPAHAGPVPSHPACPAAPCPLNYSHAVPPRNAHLEAGRESRRLGWRRLGLALTLRRRCCSGCWWTGPCLLLRINVVQPEKKVWAGGCGGAS